MSHHTKKLAVLFADICGSTALYDRCGDELARHLIASCITTLTTEVIAYQGTLIKTIGDEIMCTFSTAQTALQAACAMQNAVKNSLYNGTHKLYIRIGFHYGDVICELNDVFGDTVNVAARIASAARANHIMTSQAVIEVLPTAFHEKTQLIMRAEFKGKQQECSIYRVIWEENDDGTFIDFRPTHCKKEHTAELILRYGGQSFALNKNRNHLIVGRENSCDIVISGNFASRQHARFEVRRDKFVIVDQSTNGTYICLTDGSISHITRQEQVLHGSGSISLGQSYSKNPTELIEFSIEHRPIV